MTGSTYVVLLPVKPPARGKSRLDVDPVRRRSLAAAFALDTARACLAAARVAAVLAVTDDARFADDLRAAGCESIPDGVTGNLNESLRQAAAEASRRWPDGVPVALDGRAVTIWRKEADGEWRCAVDVWNSDSAA